MWYLDLSRSLFDLTSQPPRQDSRHNNPCRLQVGDGSLRPQIHGSDLTFHKRPSALGLHRRDSYCRTVELKVLSQGFLGTPRSTSTCCDPDYWAFERAPVFLGSFRGCHAGMLFHLGGLLGSCVLLRPRGRRMEATQLQNLHLWLAPAWIPVPFEGVTEAWASSLLCMSGWNLESYLCTLQSEGSVNPACFFGGTYLCLIFLAVQLIVSMIQAASRGTFQPMASSHLDGMHWDVYYRSQTGRWLSVKLFPQ